MCDLYVILWLAVRIGLYLCICVFVRGVKDKATGKQKRNLPELPGWEIVKPNLVPRWEMVKPILHLLSQSSLACFKAASSEWSLLFWEVGGHLDKTPPKLGWKLTEILRACSKQLLQNGPSVLRIGLPSSTSLSPCWKSFKVLPAWIALPSFYLFKNR